VRDYLKDNPKLVEELRQKIEAVGMPAVSAGEIAESNGAAE
jgi:hypothetical protein